MVDPRGPRRIIAGGLILLAVIGFICAHAWWGIG